MKGKMGNTIPNDDIYLFNTGHAEKAWLCFGCRRLPEAGLYRFLVWAPNAASVSVVGDFNSWDENALTMEPVEGGCWIAFSAEVQEGSLYKYCITGRDGKKVLKADPFAAFGQCGVNTASIIWTEEDYPWTDGGYLERRAERNFLSEPMSIYEVHAGAWKFFPSERPIYRSLADSLSGYCREMGYTHVELMPVTEYPFDGSWGYQVSGYYAPTSRYGTPEDFQYFVNTMHENGIGVLIDWVPAHFPKDEHGLARFDGTAQFECKNPKMAEHPDWGTLIFDYASDQVRSFLISSACKFLDVFHVDGIRVDAVSSMLYLDYNRKPGEWIPNANGGNINLHAVEFLKQFNKTVLTNYPGTVTIAEESTAYPLVTAPPELGGLGFCLKWDMGYMHDTLKYMQMNSFFRSKNHDKLTFSMMYAFSENFILAYSHDEVVHGKKSMVDKMFGGYEEKFSSLRVLYGYQFAHPGKKLTFMGSEFAQFIEFDEKRELDWFLLEYPKHIEMQRFCAALNRIYSANSALHRIDNSWDGFHWLNVHDSSRSCIAFERMAQDSCVVAVMNFTPVPYEGFRIGMPARGELRLILNSDDYQYGGKGTKTQSRIFSENEGFDDLPCSATLTLPGLSVLYYEFVKEETEKK